MEDFATEGGSLKKSALEDHQKRESNLADLKSQWAYYQKKIDRYIQRQIERSGDLPSQIEDLEKQINEKCPHPLDQLEYEAVFLEGGYDYDSETRYYVKCKTCGHRKKMEVEYHDY
jgi:hypothetical protein